MLPSLRLSLPPKKAPRRAVLKWDMGFETFPRDKGCIEEGKNRNTR